MKIREDKQANYRALFFNGKTVRQRLDWSKPFGMPKTPEILDIAINSKCFAACSYCYTNALKSGQNFDKIVDKAIDLWSGKDQNELPFQIAIGGAGESTLHPDWIEYVKTVNQLGIVPNYTTNGMHLSDKVLEATEQWCGGVAVSWHPHIKKIFHDSIQKLSAIKTKLNCHVIVGQPGSLKDLKHLYELYHDQIDYFVVLPYQAAGRGAHINTANEWRDTFDWISTVNSHKFAFGALFYDWLKNNNIALDMSIYEPEIFSGYVLFDDSYKTIRRSSYDLRPKEII